MIGHVIGGMIPLNIQCSLTKLCYKIGNKCLDSWSVFAMGTAHQLLCHCWICVELLPDCCQISFHLLSEGGI